MPRNLNWFNGLVSAAVLIILIASGANAMMGFGFDALSLAGAVSMLLSLPVIYRMVTKPARKR